MIMSILSKKNFFERLSGSRLSREAPRMEATNNGMPSIVINKVSEKNSDRLSMIFRRFLNARVPNLGRARRHLDEWDWWWQHLLREQLGFRHLSHSNGAVDTGATLEQRESRSGAIESSRGRSRPLFDPYSSRWRSAKGSGGISMLDSQWNCGLQASQDLVAYVRERVMTIVAHLQFNLTSTITFNTHKSVKYKISLSMQVYAKGSIRQRKRSSSCRDSGSTTCRMARHMSADF